LVTNNSSKSVKLHTMEILTNARKKTTSKNCYLCCKLSSNSSWNFHPDMVAALPKRHLVTVTKKASEFHLLFFYTLCWN